MRALAWLVGLLVVLAACTRGTSSSADRSRPLPRSILSPAPSPTPLSNGLSFCPMGLQRGTRISLSDVAGKMDGHLPHWLPGGFGLAGAWDEGSGRVSANWTDAKCRELIVFFSRSGMPDPSPGPHVGRWTVTFDVPDGCGNAILGMGRCLGYQATASSGAVSVEAIGLDRSAGDRIVQSIPL